MKEIIMIIGICIVWLLAVHGLWHFWYPRSKDLSITFKCRSIKDFKKLIADNKEIKLKIIATLILTYSYNIFVMVVLVKVFQEYGIISKEALLLGIGYVGVQAFNFFLQEKLTCTNNTLELKLEHAE